MVHNILTCILDRNAFVLHVSFQVCISGIPLVPRATSPAKYVCPVLEEACCLCVKKQHTLPLHIQDVAEDNSSWFHALETSSRTATEVATSDAVVAVGMGCRATVQLYELAARSKGCVARFTLPHATGSIEACAFPQSITQPPPNSSEAMDVDAEHQTCAFLEYGLYAGGQNGELAGWDLRYPLRPLMQISDEKGAVHQIKAFASPNGSQVLLLVGRSDGRVVVYSYNPSVGNSDKLTTLEDPSAFSQSTLELTGINCEPVRGLVGLPLFRGTNLSIWTASLGGVFRHYKKLATDLAFG
ncbi:unnamed protein product [Dicrocoelium dendriticum]|nr:unnamed protein product [Dicrocoelium dendriticum]